ncbi:MAG: ribonuclease HII [Pseudobdellovibrionaceae bacterium]
MILQEDQGRYPRGLWFQDEIKKMKNNMGPVDYTLFHPQPVIGVDEVGRGCLAGPVYAAAVILLNKVGVDQLTDSKKITPEKREILSKIIHENHAVAIGSASVEEVDQINILQASFLAMRRAVESLWLNYSGSKVGSILVNEDHHGIKKILTTNNDSHMAAHILVDGNFVIPNLKGFAQTALVKGDLRAAPISAASIVAKVARDRWITELDAKMNYIYRFSDHKGYSTALHKSLIARHGPSPWHRKTFAGVKEHLEKQRTDLSP